MQLAQTKTATPPATKRAPKTIAGTLPPSADKDRAQALTHYESALRLMQAGKFEDAHIAFNKMLTNSPGDLAERIRMYISACLQQAAKGKNTFATPEERYDY